MGRLAIIIGSVAVFALITIYMTTYTVHQSEQAILLQFGAPQESVNEPGLHLKNPLQNVVYFSKRILNIESDQQELTLGDRKRIKVTAFARWKISDPLKFYQTQKTEVRAREQLKQLANASVALIISSESLAGMLSAKRDDVMRRIAADVNTKTSVLGIDVVDVRLRQVELPDSNALTVYGRMETERQRDASELRALGLETSKTIRSQADRDVTVLKAQAQKESAIKRGEGDGTRAKIYADAFNRDPKFFAFYRSMKAYEEALGGKDTTIVLSPDSEFFRYFGQLPRDLGGGQ
jgi:modulator of FtsH protease HflC